jgi:hypothetical protein
MQQAFIRASNHKHIRCKLLKMSSFRNNLRKKENEILLLLVPVFIKIRNERRRKATRKKSSIGGVTCLLSRSSNQLSKQSKMGTKFLIANNQATIFDCMKLANPN